MKLYNVKITSTSSSDRLCYKNLKVKSWLPPMCWTSRLYNMAGSLLWKLSRASQGSNMKFGLVYWWAHNQDVLMVRNNHPWCCVADSDPPRNPDQDPDVAMADATSGSTPHGGKEQDGQPDQEPLPNLEALGPVLQEGQQPAEPANLNEMQGHVPPSLSKDWSASASSRELVSSWSGTAHYQDYGYNTAKKLSHLKPDDVNILCKTIHSP